MLNWAITNLKRAFRVGVAIAACLGSAGVAGAAQSMVADITFPQTGVTLSDAHGFLTYWQAHGGLAQFGYPLSAERSRSAPPTGDSISPSGSSATVSNITPRTATRSISVLLGLAGARPDAGRESGGRFPPVSDPHSPECLYFSRDGHTLCHTFRAYWEQHGGLALYGYPLSEEFRRKAPPTARPTPCNISSATASSTTPRTRAPPMRCCWACWACSSAASRCRHVPQADTATPLQVPDAVQGRRQVEDAAHPDRPGGHEDKPLRHKCPALRMMAVAPNGDLFVSATRARHRCS